MKNKRSFDDGKIDFRMFRDEVTTSMLNSFHHEPIPVGKSRYDFVRDLKSKEDKENFEKEFDQLEEKWKERGYELGDIIRNLLYAEALECAEDIKELYKKYEGK